MSTWPRARTVALSAALTLVLALIITAFCTVLGVIGAALVANGVTSQADITSPVSIVNGIVIGSAVLSLIISACISYTLTRPLLEMTAAVNELARGNFDVRMRKRGRFSIREVDEFARSFNAAAEELSGTEMMRASFVSDFSHEFRTPINSLAGFAQLARDEDLAPEERDEYLGIVVEESQRLARLSERILALSKMEATAIVPHVERVDVAEQIRRAVLLLEPAWDMKLTYDYLKSKGSHAKLILGGWGGGQPMIHLNIDIRVVIAVPGSLYSICPKSLQIKIGRAHV